MSLITVLFLSVFCKAELDEALASKKDCSHDAQNFRCVKFIKNYDADTATFLIPDVHPLLGEKISVRVRGIDTAEMSGKSPCEKDKAITARELVGKALESAKRIDLKNVERDKYFRVLADIYIDNKSLKDIITEAGLGYAYNGGTKQHPNWCEFGSKRIPAKDGK